MNGKNPEIDTRYDYELPDEKIARHPALHRDESRLMRVDPGSGLIVDLGSFRSLAGQLARGDLLVLNNTRVFPARLRGKRRSGGAVEVLLLDGSGSRVKALVRPLTKIRLGETIFFGSGAASATLAEKTAEGPAILEFAPATAREVADKWGEMPIPPYLKRPVAREDGERYQTVYADAGSSSAAPTAGLHFTPELLEAIRKQGVEIAYIRLDVGYGTFAPVRPDQTQLHLEHYVIPEGARRSVERFMDGAAGEGRLIAVGTTVVRALESYARTGRPEDETDIYIRPGHEFKAVDALVTNFHLPGSSLLRLVHAFGGDLVFEAYRRALEWGFRFFSYGDAMLLMGRKPR